MFFLSFVCWVNDFNKVLIRVWTKIQWFILPSRWRWHQTLSPRYELARALHECSKWWWREILRWASCIYSSQFVGCWHQCLQNYWELFHFPSVKHHLISRPVARSLENLQRLLKSCLVLSLSVWSVRAGMILLLLLTNSTVPSKHTPKAHPVAVIVVIFV